MTPSASRKGEIQYAQGKYKAAFKEINEDYKKKLGVTLIIIQIMFKFPTVYLSHRKNGQRPSAICRN